MAKRKVIRSVPIFREDQGKCMQWCLANGIRIHVQQGNEYHESDYRKRTVWKIKPYKDGLVRLSIFDNGEITESPKMYTQDEAHIKIWELYCYMYDKYSQQT